MDRELLIEIGTEEIPASWLPGLTLQVGTVLHERLTEARLSIDEPIETYSTPRRLTVRVGKIGERQTDLEELVTGPPVSAAYGPTANSRRPGRVSRRNRGSSRTRSNASRLQRGSTSASESISGGEPPSTCFPRSSVVFCAASSFPKQMKWDALLEDGRGELPFGRPIRWLLFLYGGRVVPFAIQRSPAAEGSLVESIHTGAMTYGHRFPDDERARRPGDQGQELRRLSQASGRELCRARAQRASRPHCPRARCRSESAWRASRVRAWSVTACSTRFRIWSSTPS